MKSAQRKDNHKTKEIKGKIPNAIAAIIYLPMTKGRRSQMLQSGIPGKRRAAMSLDAWQPFTWSALRRLDIYREWSGLKLSYMQE